MLVQPSSYSPSQEAAFANSTTPAGVEAGAVRADIPPINETEKDQPSQNQQFSQSGRFVSSDTVNSDADVTEQQGDASAVEQQSAPQQQSTDRPSQGNTADDRSIESRQQAEDQVVIEQLKARDREVRLHESAHASVGGRYAGAPSLEYTQGPDGKNYATGGEVSISSSEVAGDPQATIEKARVIRSAALAPAQPSSQDRRVAAEAGQLELQAREELRQIQVEETNKEKQVQDKSADKVRERKEPDEEIDATLIEDEQSNVVEIAEPPVVSVPATETTSKTSNQSEEEGKDDNARERPNALAELEKILLGSTGLLQQANQQGLVNPQNPYGKSGFLDILA